MNARRPKKATARAIRCGEEDRAIVPAGKKQMAQRDQKDVQLINNRMQIRQG
jgi:hypothetical protein